MVCHSERTEESLSLIASLALRGLAPRRPRFTASRSALHAAGRVHAESGASPRRPSDQAAPCFRPPPSSPAAPPPPQATPSQPPTPANEHLIAGGALGGSFGGVRAQCSAPLAEDHRGGCGAVTHLGAAAADAARVPTSGYARPADADLAAPGVPRSARATKAPLMVPGEELRPGTFAPLARSALAAPWFALLCIIN